MTNIEPKIVLPKELQTRMLKFFLKTSIPRNHALGKNKAKNQKSKIQF